MFVMQATTHPAELCPSHEPKFRAITVTWYEKVGATAAKHGIKFVGSYTDTMAHTIYALYDTPGMDVMMQFLMEPEIMAMSTFSTGRMFPVFDHSTVMAMIKK
jgi:hypothetical protein